MSVLPCHCERSVAIPEIASALVCLATTKWVVIAREALPCHCEESH